jgi:LCP family protein required for cell wall assembly
MNRNSPILAAVLSFVFPGLGQAIAGRFRRGLIVAIPALAITAVFLWFYLFNFRALRDAVVKPDWLVAILVIDLVAMAYHVWAILDAYQVAGGSFGRPAVSEGKKRWAGAALVAVLLVTTVGVHGALAVADVKDQQFLADTFSAFPKWLSADGQDAPGDSAIPSIILTDPTPNASLTPTPTPSPTPKPASRDWAKDGRLNLLIVGTDAGQGRGGLRPDTMILATVDLKTGRAAMIGIPRNLWMVPLPQPAARAFEGGRFPYMLNWIYKVAWDNPKYFPGGDLRGFKAIEGAVGTLTGLPVDGMVLVNLMGFVNLIDAIGGIDINVPADLKDDAYPTPEGIGNIKIRIYKGQQHMDGHKALAYARSRHQDWDYTRMERQQLVLRAIREQTANPCSLIPQIPSLLSTMGNSGGMFWTDMPIESAPDLLGVVASVGSHNTASITLSPWVTGAKDTADKSDVLDNESIANIRYISKHALDKVPAAVAGNSSGGVSIGCF